MSEEKGSVQLHLEVTEYLEKRNEFCTIKSIEEKGTPMF